MRRIAMLLLLAASLSCSRTATQVANTATDDAIATGPTTNTATSAPAAIPQQPKAPPTSAKTSRAQAVPARQ